MDGNPMIHRACKKIIPLAIVISVCFSTLSHTAYGQQDEAKNELIKSNTAVPQVTFSNVDAVVTNGSITFGFDVTTVTPKSGDWVAIVRKGDSWLRLSDGDYGETLGASAGTLTLRLPLPAATAANFVTFCKCSGIFCKRRKRMR